MSWAWYPLNKLDGLCSMLVHANVRGEDGDAEIGLVLSLVELEGQESEKDLAMCLEDFDQDVQDLIEDELLAVGTDASHENWKGFAMFVDLAFPRARTHCPCGAALTPKAIADGLSFCDACCEAATE